MDSGINIRYISSLLYVKVDILLTSWINYLDRIISWIGDVWAHKLILPATFYYLSACIKPEKWAVIYLCVKGIDFASTYDFDIWFCCSDSVVF